MSSAGEVRQRQEHRLRFHGTGSEFFRIWSVNLALSLVTLGIYTAWAKVRTQRYFMGQSELDSHRFDYHADPLRILKGRLIAVFVLLIYNFSELAHPIIPGLLGIVFFFLVPWLINAALRFQARMTSYRGIRFGFAGSYGGTFLRYLAMPILGVMTFGLLLPVAAWLQARYLADNYRFGDRHFAARPPWSRYYGVYIAAVLIFVVIAGLWLTALFPLLGEQAQQFMDRLAAMNLVQYAKKNPQPGEPDPTALVILTAGPIIAYIVASNFLAAWTINLQFNHLSLQEGHGFHSSLSAPRYAWIAISNFVLIAITIGLAMPWARARMARYRLGCTALLAAGNLDTIAAGMAGRTNVAGEELADLWDADIGI